MKFKRIKIIHILSALTLVLSSCSPSADKVLLSTFSFLTGNSSDKDTNGNGISSLSANSQTLEYDVSYCYATQNGTWSSQIDGNIDRGFFYPEENAVYWGSGLPKLTGQSAHYRFEGKKANARFVSFQTYTYAGSSVDYLDDSLIIYDGEGNYTIPLYGASSVPDPKPAGTLYGNDSDESGNNYVIVYRVYYNKSPDGTTVPAGYTPEQWEKQGQVFLPKIFYVVDDPNGTHYNSAEEVCAGIDPNPPIFKLGEIATQIGNIVSPILSDLNTGIALLANNPPGWFIGGDMVAGILHLFDGNPVISAIISTLLSGVEGNAFPNDATGYYSTYVNSNFGQVMVTKFKAPSFPNTDAGQVIDPSSQQVRFWSVCMNIPALLYTADCKKDSEFKIDPDGYVRIAISWPEDRPKDPATGTPFENWIALASPNNLVIYRQMLPSQIFTQSASSYKKACQANDPSLACLDDYEAIKEYSGDYGPVSKYCSKREFERNKCGF